MEEYSMYFDRIHLLILDSVGIGEAPDAEQFGDIGAHTLGNIAQTVGLSLPNFEALGLGNIADLEGVTATNSPAAYYTKLQEESVGKDTMTGHWELMGLNIDTPFKVFPDGFPEELLANIRQYSKRGIVANCPASGTEIINQYGEHQMDTGDLIVYTSADSVLQIAAHESVIPVEELYDICQYVRDLTMDDPYMIGRIIARPYVGTPGQFKRTSNRKDYALNPFSNTVLDYLSESGKSVIAVGKINDIFNGQGITDFVKTKHNDDGITQMINVMGRDFTGLSFTNLVDFDSEYGHRRDPQGYKEALEHLDRRLPEIMNALNKTDLLIITADHGNDPTHDGTDHTREFVPVLMYSPSIEHPEQLRQGYFADISATIADNFEVQSTGNGRSFLQDLV